MSEAKLSFPGAISIGDLNFDQTTTIEGQQNAETGHEFGTNASASDVISYYNHELGSLGWQPTNLNAEPYNRNGCACLADGPGCLPPVVSKARG